MGGLTGDTTGVAGAFVGALAQLERHTNIATRVDAATKAKQFRDRIEVELIGSPLTHERFLRRPQGTYGPAWRAGQNLFPGPGLAGVPGLLSCGDSTFPGIGVPAVAASGLTAANSLVPVDKHLQLLEEMKDKDLMPDQCMV